MDKVFYFIILYATFLCNCCCLQLGRAVEQSFSNESTFGELLLHASRMFWVGSRPHHKISQRRPHSQRGWDYHWSGCGGIVAAIVINTALFFSNDRLPLMYQSKPAFTIVVKLAGSRLTLKAKLLKVDQFSNPVGAVDTISIQQMGDALTVPLVWR